MRFAKKAFQGLPTIVPEGFHADHVFHAVRQIAEVFLLLPWLYLAVAIVAEVVGTSFLKASNSFTRPLPVLAVVIGYGLSFYFLSLTLETIPVGIAYAIWSGVGLVLITLVGWLAYGQGLDLPAALGMGMILTGVLVLNLFSQAAGH